MGHSVLPPSSAKIWGAPGGCTGWVIVNAAQPEEESSEAALDGTVCHEVAEAMVTGGDVPAVGTMVEVGERGEDGVILARMVTQEMHEAATLYAETVRAVADPHGRDTLVGIEARVRATSVHPTESYGTVDTYVHGAAANALHVLDLKYGFGVVEAFENWQMINYAAGICDELGLTDPTLAITFCIVQPRAYHREGPVREWATTLGGIAGHIETLRENAERALGPYAVTHAGDHCRYCKGRPTCEAAIAAGYSAMELSGSVMPLNMSDEELSIMYETFTRGQKQLEYITTALEEEIKSRIRGGANVPGYGMVSSRGRTTWAVSVDEVIAAGDFHEIDLRKNDVVTPAQAKKLGLCTDGLTEHRAGLKLEKQDINKARAVFARK